jgi:CDGSH-type Zn-finger protein
MNRILKSNMRLINNISNIRFYCVNKVPKNTIEHLISGHQQPENGSVYDKKPFKMHLEEGKSYSWCLCGKSKNQPICDGFHKNTHYKITLRPVKFQVEKTGEEYIRFIIDICKFVLIILPFLR